MTQAESEKRAKENYEAFMHSSKEMFQAMEKAGLISKPRKTPKNTPNPNHSRHIPDTKAQ